MSSRLHLQRLDCLSVAVRAAVLLAAVAGGIFFSIPLRAQSPSPAASAAVAKDAKEDLVTVLKSSGNFTTFLKAIDVAGLTATLEKPGTLTVFAPTDAAFSKLPTGKLDELLKPENKARLVSIISYHIAPTRLSSADLARADEVKTMEGSEIDVDTSADGKVIELDEAKVLGSDLDASNGVLHAIDSVLQPF